MAKAAKSSAKSSPATNGAGELVMIEASKLDPRPDNGRKRFNKDKLKELAQSIRENGVLEPLLVRPRDNGRFEIVAGWRRWTASKDAKLTNLLCYVKNMTDEEAAYAGAIENLQREDLDPVDEAAEFARLLGDGKSAKAVAQRLGKEPQYVIRRVPLSNLIEEAAEDLRAGRIYMGHALEIALLLPDDQKLALDECYGTDYVKGKQVPDKEVLDLTVEELRKWIATNIMLVLERAPFALDDTRLREDALTCLKCPERTGNNQALFEDMFTDKKDRCRDRKCFVAKTMKFIQLEAVRIKPKGSEEPAPIIVDYGYQPQEGQLGRNSFFVEEKASERCDRAERAVWGAGSQLGKTAWICRHPECEKHAGRVNKLSSSNRSSGVKSLERSTADSTKKAERKQEIFNMKSDEVFRRKVFAVVRKKYKFPFGRPALNRVAWMLFKGLEHHHKVTVREEIGVEVDAFSQVAAMKDKELAEFLNLCSVVHEGANRYGASGNQVSQKGVIDLAEEHEVDWKKLDAEARVEVAEKKYKKHLQTLKLYKEEVEAGKHADPPNLFAPNGESPFDHMLKKPYSYMEEDDFEDSEAIAKPEDKEEDDEELSTEDLDWDKNEEEEYSEEEDD